MSTKTAIDAPRGPTTYRMDPNDVFVLGVDDNSDKSAPLYDSRAKWALDEGLLKNIKAFGVLTAISVTKQNDRLTVVDGKQRVLHLREANRQLVAEGKEPYSILCQAPLRGDNSHLYGVMTSSNNRREDTFEIKAERALKLSQEYHKTNEEIAVALMCTPQYVEQLLSYWDLAPEVREAMKGKESGVTIAPTAAIKLAALPAVEQKKEVAKLVETAKASGQKRVTGATVQKQLRERDGIDTAPSKRLMNKILQHKDFKTLDEGVQKAFKYLNGMASADRISGLKAIILDVEGEKK